MSSSCMNSLPMKLTIERALSVTSSLAFYIPYCTEYLYETNLDSDTWKEITIPAEDFSKACFMDFYFTRTMEVGNQFFFTSLFGTLK